MERRLQSTLFLYIVLRTEVRAPRFPGRMFIIMKNSRFTLTVVKSYAILDWSTDHRSN